MGWLVNSRDMPGSFLSSGDPKSSSSLYLALSCALYQLATLSPLAPFLTRYWKYNNDHIEIEIVVWACCTFPIGKGNGLPTTWAWTGKKNSQPLPFEVIFICVCMLVLMPWLICQKRPVESILSFPLHVDSGDPAYPISLSRETSLEPLCSLRQLLNNFLTSSL